MSIKAVVLAAGKGTRMMSEANNLPKVLRQACGKPLLHYVLRALDFIPVQNTVLVAGYMREKVFEAFPDYPRAVQDPQLGTGHAVMCAREHLEGFDGTVLVCYGDMPLLRKEVYQGLLDFHARSGAACTMLSGTCDEASLSIIIRDHDKDRFEERKRTAAKIADVLNEKYGEGTVTAVIHDSYYNMLSKIKPHMHLVENAKKAMEEAGVTPLVQPIRGGTDGCVISFRGIPCPNLFTGAHNYHSRFEYVSAQEMALSAETLIRIMNRYAEYDVDR